MVKKGVTRLRTTPAFRWQRVLFYARTLAREGRRVEPSEETVLHQQIRRQLLIDELLRGLDTGDWQAVARQQSDLYQHGCLVPIDMLVVQLSAPEANNGYERNLDIVTRRRHTRQHPVDLAIMGETEDHLVHDPIRSDRPRNWDRLRVPWIDVQKVVLVEIV